MNLRQIRAFLFIAKHRSFTLAAEELGVTQPAISLMIREFEEEIGVKVFSRSTRTIYLTPVGEALENDLKMIMSDFDRVFASLDESVRVRKGNVNIASLSTIAIRLLPSVITTCRQLHPGVNISLRDGTSSTVFQRVLTGAADFGISTNDDPTREVLFTPLIEESFSVICNRKHRFAEYESITWDELCGADFIGMTEETGIGRLIDGISANRKTSLNYVFRVFHLSTVLGQVEENLGVALLPESAKPSPDHHALAKVPLADIDIRRTIGVLRRRDRPPSAAASAVLDVVSKHMERSAIE